MINSACELAVSRAMSAQEHTSKKRKITFHTAEGNETLDTDDIQQQVEELKLYREKNNSDEESSSSESSKDSDSWKECPEETEEINSLTNSQIFSLRDLLVGNFPINQQAKGEVLSPIVFIYMFQKRKPKDIFTLKALLDSGATATLINSKFVKKMKKTQMCSYKLDNTKWSVYH